MLSAYKAQNVSVERGFRFLKDPLFFASSLFLEKPQRIMALANGDGNWPLLVMRSQNGGSAPNS